MDKTPVRTTLVVLATAVVLGGGGATLWDVTHPPQTRTISPSYAFDVTNPELLAGFSKSVAVVTIEDAGTPVKLDQQIYTDYRATVQQALKGSLTGAIEVRQTGGQDGEDTYVLEDQPLLRKGEQYVLVLGQNAGEAEFTIVAGPLSARPLPPGQVRRDEVLGAWRSAVAKQKNPTP